MKFATAVLATSATVSGAKLVAVANTNETPSRAGVWSIDTAAKSATKLGDVDGGYSYLSGAAVCNNKYYAVATDAPISMGLVTLDLSTGKDTPVVTTNYLAHSLWCFNGPDELLAWSSAPAPPFSLVTVNATDGTEKRVVAGPFGSGGAGGTDSVFSFDAAIGQSWAMFPREGNVGGGTLVAVGVSTGNSTSFEIDKGYSPYAAFVTAPPKEGAEFNGLCSYGGDIDGDVLFAKNTFSKGKVKTSPGKKVPEAYTGGQPLTPCGGLYYGVNEDTTLFAIDPAANTLTVVMNLKAPMKVGNGQKVGGLACIQ